MSNEGMGKHGAMIPDQHAEALKATPGHTTLDMILHYAKQAGADLAMARQTAGPVRGLKVGG